MAYRAPDAWEILLPTQSDSPPPVQPGLESEAAAFAPLELQVISLTALDPPSSLRRPSRLARLVERWLGLATRKPLANPRLEALRRFAVLARSARGRLPARELERFLSAGFTKAQAQRLLQGAG
jgi:hypothetical protein